MSSVPSADEQTEPQRVKRRSNATVCKWRPRHLNPGSSGQQASHPPFRAQCQIGPGAGGGGSRGAGTECGGCYIFTIYSPVLMNQLEAKKKKGNWVPSWLPNDMSPKLRPNISVKPNRLLHLGPGLRGDITNSMAHAMSPESQTEKMIGCQRRAESPLRPGAFTGFCCDSLQAWGKFPRWPRSLASQPAAPSNHSR